jgi:hypothetical protein
MFLYLFSLFLFFGNDKLSFMCHGAESTTVGAAHHKLNDT